MSVGDTLQLSARVVPSNATNKGFYFSSDNENVATVGTTSGFITAREPGTATITVTSASNPRINAQCSLYISGAGYGELSIYAHSPYVEPKATSMDSMSQSFPELASSGSGSGSFIPQFGHACITYKNLQWYDVVFGNMTVEPNQEVSIGLWELTLGGEKRGGIYYNLEAYRYNVKNDGRDRVSLTNYITKDDLDTINEYILDEAHDKWEITYNCVNFAKDIWNSVSDDKVLNIPKGIYYPIELVPSIRSYSYHEIERTLGYNENAGYYEDGTFVSVPKDWEIE